MDEASCVGRSKTDLGSSLQYPATQGLGQFQDSNPAYNPGQSNFQLFVEVFCFSSTDQTRPAGRPAGRPGSGQLGRELHVLGAVFRLFLRVSQLIGLHLVAFRHVFVQLRLR